MKLKRKCAIAILIAPVVLTLKKAAINAVMVVPMFAPKMNGAALRNGTMRCATMGTTTDVVMVLERIAAVVMVPQKKDFHAFLKKNLLKRSGELANSSPEINFRKTRMDTNSNVKDNAASKKPGIIFASHSTTGPNIFHLGENEPVTGADASGWKKYSAIHCDMPDRNP